MEPRAPLTREEIHKQFVRYYEANDPDKGGSFYVQSKIFNARETLMEELKQQGASGRQEAELK